MGSSSWSPAVPEMPTPCRMSQRKLRQLQGGHQHLQLLHSGGSIHAIPWQAGDEATWKTENGGGTPQQQTQTPGAPNTEATPVCAPPQRNQGGCQNFFLPGPTLAFGSHESVVNSPILQGTKGEAIDSEATLVFSSPLVLTCLGSIWGCGLYMLCVVDLKPSQPFLHKHFLIIYVILFVVVNSS